MTATHGGARPGAGRSKGSRDAATKQAQRTISELAKEYAPQAIQALALIMESGDSESARVSAANAILDRAYGKPTQQLEHTGKDGGAIKAEVTTDAAFAQLASLVGGFIPATQGGTDGQNELAKDGKG